MALRDWKLAEELNVFQIALLSAGHDPSGFDGWNESEEWPRQTREDMAPFLNTVKHAVRAGKLECERVSSEYSADNTDWQMTLINVESYRHWLRSRNYTDKFFNLPESDGDSLSFPFGLFYAPKLAAAVRAWNEVTADPAALNGKTPKQALEAWLIKHAGLYDLLNADGTPNRTGIEEICKVANWKPQGGASKTPTFPNKRSPLLLERGGRVSANPPVPSSVIDEDEEIPF